MLLRRADLDRIASGEVTLVGQRAWALDSGLSGLVFFVSFAAIASGQTRPATIVRLPTVVAWIWRWRCALHRPVREVLG